MVTLGGVTLYVYALHVTQEFIPEGSFVEIYTLYFQMWKAYTASQNGVHVWKYITNQR